MAAWPKLVGRRARKFVAVVHIASRVAGTGSFRCTGERDEAGFRKRPTGVIRIPVFIASEAANSATDHHNSLERAEGEIANTRPDVFA